MEDTKDELRKPVSLVKSNGSRFSDEIDAIDNCDSIDDSFLKR